VVEAIVRKDNRCPYKILQSLKKSKCNIEAIAMDMSKAYISWAKNNFEAEALLKELCMTSRATEVNELPK